MLKDLITFKKPKAREAEAYRTLRTNIQFSSLDKELKTIVVTSSAPGEGKSTIMANLAITIAQSGKRVLLMDCDLRKPTVHKKMGISNTTGMTSMLVKKMDPTDCIKPTEVHNLYLLTSGPIPPNPAELLGSKRMKAMLEELKKAFDIVLIDAPPVLAVTDAQILSTMADGILLVTAYGQAEKEAVINAKKLIDKVEAKLLGVIMNKVPMKSKGYYGTYYNYEYKKEN